MTLKIGISGIRGIVDDTLTNEVASDFSRAFAAFLKSGTVVLGRDPRPSGKRFEKIIIKNLLSSGINVLYAGIVPTPTVLFLVRKMEADAGIIITASHNPIQWNGFKFVSGSGVFLNEEQNKRLFSLYYSKRSIKKAGKGKLFQLNDPEGVHIREILDNVRADDIRRKNFKVVIDSCNGAGSVITPKLLRMLNCDVVEINTDPNGKFPRGTEPVPENIRRLCKTVKETGADIGFAQDPDADRLAVVNEKGAALGEEYTLPLAASYVLSACVTKGCVVATNLSTSMMIEDVAKRFGAKVVRAKVGEINVVETLLKAKGIIGGEGNGGVIYPSIVTSRDSLTGIALILSLMAGTGKKVSALANAIPHYHMIKTKITCGTKGDVARLLKKAKAAYRKEKMDLRDGIKVIMKEAWVHIRASNTEPVVRIIAEAKSRKIAEGLIRKVSG